MLQYLMDSGEKSKRFRAEAIANYVGMLGDAAFAMTHNNQKVALFEHGTTTQIFFAFKITAP